MKVIGLSWFADRRLRSELAAQKTANTQLSKRLKFEKNRANQLTVNLKTHKSRCGTLRKKLREAEQSKDSYALEVMHSSTAQRALMARISTET